ncbi:MAG: YezD family protein [Thermoactinomyces sp.]
MVQIKQGTEKEKYKIILKELESLKFGELQITVHEGKIVQVNRIEKHRFPV